MDNQISRQENYLSEAEKSTSQLAAGENLTSASQAKRLVIKIGSSTLTTTESSLDYDFLQDLADQVAAVKKAGWQPVIVTSAAIACGLEALGIKQRPSDMPSLQAAASVGQSALSTAYAQVFRPHNMVTSTVLLTRRDTADRGAYLHARDTLLRLLDLGVVPIVNENDTISVEQIRFGDNDTLAALAACLIDADLMVILSDIDGLYTANPQTDSSAELISEVKAIGPEILSVAGGAGSTVGSGGMITKIKAARVLMAAGIPLVICHGKTPQIIVDAASEKSVGTRFVAQTKPHVITPKKLWLALGDASRGALVVDAGAKTALVSQGRSLLAVGVRSVEGQFASGDIVDIKDETGHVIARGKVAFSRDETALAIGRSREELQNNRLLASLAERPLIHRDDLIVFE